MNPVAGDLVARVERLRARAAVPPGGDGAPSATGDLVTAADPCGCIVCRPDLRPNGYADVVATWPPKYRAQFEAGTRARAAVGVAEADALRLAYGDALDDLNRSGRGSRR